MRRLASLAAFILIAAGVWAYDFAAAGFTVVGTTTIDGRSYTLLRDASGATLPFSAEVEPTDARMVALASVLNAVHGWQSIKPAQIRAINFADGLEFIVMPGSFTNGGLDLVKALPAGIELFYRGGASYYDFKLKSETYVVRVRGLYTGEGDLVAHIVDAYRNPQTYAAAYDPVALLRRLLSLEAQAANDAAKIKILETRLAADDAIVASLQKRVARDETALMASLDGGVPIDPAAITRLVQLKEANPALGKVDAETQLSAEKLGLSPRQLDAAFLVLFGEH